MDKTLEKKITKLRDSDLSWKAKEILSGKIGQQEYQPELYRLYGEVLLDLGDMYEAGKYLFLGGGADDPKCREAVSIFLQRHNKKDAYGFFALMPKRFVAAAPELYPESVREYIKEQGFKKKDLEKIQLRYSAEAGDLSIYEKAFFTSAAALMIVAIIIGLWVIISTAYGWLFS
jgi:hypothetical protein